MPDSITVCFDLAVRNGSLSIWSGDKRLVAAVFEDDRNSEGLLVVLDDALRGIDSDPDAITEIVCGLGPGSYTGIRAAIAAARGFRDSVNCRAFGYSTIQALSAEYSGSQAVACLCGAGRGELCVGLRESSRGDFRPLAIVNGDSIADYLAQHDIDAVVAESGVSDQVGESLRHTNVTHVRASDNVSGLLYAFHKGNLDGNSELLPEYGRKFGVKGGAN
jgi:tRNA threonylcarbamoyl adenosine modification protein YeaZ